IVCLRQAPELGTPIPERELFGHTKAVYCLYGDEQHGRLFSGGNDNSICVWFRNEKLNDLMQLQALTSVHKSNGFTCLVVMSNIDSIATGTDNGYMIRSKSLFSHHLLDQSTSTSAPKKTQTRNKVWKCVYSWRAHDGRVLSIQYIEKDNVLVTSGEDGCVRVVYMCHPGLFPSVQVAPKDNDLETVHLSFSQLNKNRLSAGNYSPIVRQTLGNVFDEIEKRDSQNAFFFFKKIMGIEKVKGD
ncbi:hypothetical protein RFI_28817, partial [Reticulomyxa filosa]